MANIQTGTSQFFDLSIKQGHEAFDQNFFGYGKILLSGEYFVLNGADALALPTQAGQSLSVKYEQSFNPVLSWRAYDSNGELWFEADFEFWKFDILSPNKSDQKASISQKLLRQARIQNKHFLRDEQNVYVETKLGFPKDWGLGSSSSLIYNLAQWAYISPFELLFETSKGSGYDVACAQSSGAILYNLESLGLYGLLSFLTLNIKRIFISSILVISKILSKPLKPIIKLVGRAVSLLMRLV